MHCKCTFARRRAPHESLCAWVDVGQIRRRSASRRYAAHDVPLRTCPGSRPHDRGSTARGKIGAALTAPTIPARDVCPFSMIGARSPGHLPATAVLLIVGAVGCFALLDACIKYLTRSYPVPVLVFARYLVQALALVVWAGPALGPGLFRTAQPRLQIVRVTLFYPALCGTVLMALVLPFVEHRFDWSWPHALLLVIACLLVTVGHFMFILAFQRAPASAITPFTYMQLVFAVALGFGVFGDFPDAFTLAGMAIISGSGLVLAWHERRRASPG